MATINHHHHHHHYHYLIKSVYVILCRGAVC